MTSFLIEKNTKKSFDEKIAKLAIMPMISTLSILNYADPTTVGQNHFCIHIQVKKFEIS